MGKITIPNVAKTTTGVPKPPNNLALFAHNELNSLLILFTREL